MTLDLQQAAELVGGQLWGESESKIVGANPPSEASSREITMLDDLTHWKAISSTQAVAVVTPELIELEDSQSISQIVVDDPHHAFAKLVSYFRPPMHNVVMDVGIDDSAEIATSATVHPSATVGPGVKIGKRTIVHPGAVIMPNCSIADDCIIHANVTLYEYTQIEDHVIIHAGSVIGANGFGYRSQSGRHVPSAQLGYVHIECDVEIGAATTIDRGTYGATSIGEGTKIDNQVMIAHNCKIGRHNLLCSQVGIAGSCTTGDYVILAGQVGLKDHIVLGDKTIIGAQAGVMDNCEGNEVYLGSPATPQRDQMQIMAVQRRLPEMRREIKQLRRELDKLQSDNETSEKRAA